MRQFDEMKKEVMIIGNINRPVILKGFWKI